MRSTIVLAAIAIVICAAAIAAGQPVPDRRENVTTYELVLQDGSHLYGSIERETDSEIVFKTMAGMVITAPKSEVVSIRRVSGSVVKGEFLREDPNRTRLFFGPTGRALPRGKAYIGMYEFLLPFVQVGVTDRLSIGGGTPLVFFSGEGWNRPFWVTPKFEVFRGGRTDVSVGAFMGFGEGEGAGIVYGVMTRGTPDASFTAGAGMAYASSGGRAPVVMIGGDRRAGRHTKLITENYLWQGGRGMLTAGVRFFGEQLSADLGLAVPLGTDGFFAAPVVNFVYAF
jgi:hypothetical protein